MFEVRLQARERKDCQQLSWHDATIEVFVRSLSPITMLTKVPRYRQVWVERLLSEATYTWIADNGGRFPSQYPGRVFARMISALGSMTVRLA